MQTIIYIIYVTPKFWAYESHQTVSHVRCLSGSELMSWILLLEFQLNSFQRLKLKPKTDDQESSTII